MDTYIIRVYRLQKDNPRHLVGMVESVRDNRRGKMAFTNVDDLWEILSSRMSETFFSKQREVRQCRTDRGEKKPTGRRMLKVPKKAEGDSIIR